MDYGYSQLKDSAELNQNRKFAYVQYILREKRVSRHIISEYQDLRLSVSLCRLIAILLTYSLHRHFEYVKIAILLRLISHNAVIY